jgi:lysophospholipase L1-like esterase
MKCKRKIVCLFFLAVISCSLGLAEANSPNIRIVMLGDSITAWGNWTSLLNSREVRNQGVAGDRTDDILARMEAVYRIRPKYCFVMVGINDILSGRPVETIFDNYRNIIDGLRTHAIQPVIQSTLYLAGPDFRNKSVEALNKKLVILAEERRIHYLDLNRRLAPDRQLLPAFTHDGLHLNGAGYRVWRDELVRTSLY